MNWQTLYTFASGWMLWISLFLMLGGLIYQAWSLHALTAPLSAKGYRRPVGRAKPPAASFRWSLGGREPLLAALTLIFHGALLTVPLFVSGHGVLFYQAFEVNIPAFSGIITDILTVTVLLTGVVLLLRRIVTRDIRYLSRLGDYGVLILTLLPFATGYGACHGLGDSMALMALHALSGDLFLIALGWTRLGHFVFFIYSRFMIRGEYTLAAGSRRWYLGSDGAQK